MTATKGRVLVVDDDPAVGTVLCGLLVQAGLSGTHVASGQAALDSLSRELADLVIADMRMPGMDGLELLRQINDQWREIPVIILTAHGSIALAVEAMKRGAWDFVLKPFDREQILFVVRKALAVGVEAAAPLSERFGQMVGKSPAMQQLATLIQRAAAGHSTVMLRGETGTGKELVARMVHALSPRRSQPLIKIHCAAVPDNLLESELFGYERGAFTGASSAKPGRIELANRGTVFLDEIGDITPATQVKLLRVLQDKEIERLGSTHPRKVDVRFISATHRHLERMVEEGTFREDLYYRLNVIPVEVPSLRERCNDIVLLVEHFVAMFAVSCDKRDLSIEPDAVQLLAQQPWPGNVRQLQNFVERLAVMTSGMGITVADVERELERANRLSSRAPAAFTTHGKSASTLDEQRKALERQALVEALRASRNNRAAAARLLGVSRSTLYAKLDEHGLA